MSKLTKPLIALSMVASLNACGTEESESPELVCSDEKEAAVIHDIQQEVLDVTTDTRSQVGEALSCGIDIAAKHASNADIWPVIFSSISNAEVVDMDVSCIEKDALESIIQPEDPYSCQPKKTLIEAAAERILSRNPEYKNKTQFITGDMMVSPSGPPDEQEHWAGILSFPVSNGDYECTVTTLSDLTVEPTTLAQGSNGAGMLSESELTSCNLPLEENTYWPERPDHLEEVYSR
jgi:hypothetical protein